MNLGKRTRLNRLFANPNHRLFAVAIDHFIMYGKGLPDGLRSIRKTLSILADNKPDAITMHKGIAQSIWIDYAGKIPLILQSTLSRINDPLTAQIATPEDAIRMGAEAIAVVIFLNGDDEIRNIQTVADYVHEASRYELPVVCHAYPKKRSSPHEISYNPDDIAWAVHCCEEMGVDIIKVPFCGDVPAFADIISDCSLPIVAAGGPRAESFRDTLQMAYDVICAGASGMVIGRNVWNQKQIPEAITALKYVIHDSLIPSEAIKKVGL
jgi:class I fructose-bisphosphate aldolase